MKLITETARLIPQLPKPVLWIASGFSGVLSILAGMFILGTFTGLGIIFIVLGFVGLVLEYRLANLTIKKEEQERVKRIAIWKDKQAIYTALRNHSYFVEVDNGNLMDAINRLYSLRDRWYDLTGFSQEEKLLLISAGYAMETAEDAFAKLGLDALRVQAELSR